MTVPRLLYTAALRIGSPFILWHLARRTRRQAGTADDWHARCGWVPRDDRSPVWLHGASAGEIQSLAPLAAALARDYPLRLSAFTATGRARAAALLPRLPVDLSPLDLPGVWRRYLGRTRPRALLVAETELWPNLLAAAHARRLPVWLVSARMSSASERRLRHFPATARELMASFEGVMAQSAEDLDRFVRLGLPAERGRVTGSLKQAMRVPESVREQGARLRRELFDPHPVWVAGSVRTGEERDIAEAVALVREHWPGAIALVVPRHPESAAGFKAALGMQRQDTLGAEALDGADRIPGGTTVVVDRVGVLLGLYAAADVTFVGGTLCPIGGHNVLEPAVLGRPVLVGPAIDNVRSEVRRLKSAGALHIVHDGRALGKEITALFADPDRISAMGRAGASAASDAASLDLTLEVLRAAL